MDAMARGDVDAVVDMLAEDAAWSMPPLAAWFTGVEALTGFLHHGPLSGEWRWRHAATRANGQSAVGAYTWQDLQQAHLPFALDVLTLEGAKIRDHVVHHPLDRGHRPAFYHRWPAQPADAASVAAFFESFGLPGRLD